MDKLIQIADRLSKLSFNFSYKKILDRKNAVFVVDNKLVDIYKFNLKKSFLIDAKEKNKNLRTVENIYDFFMENNVNRQSEIIAIGGGITLDITSFAVSTFKRGCKLIFVPTTLLAMVDASVGGKTAVNYKNFKNLIGTFYPADEILFDFNFINTLPEKEIQNGIAEILKTALIYDNGVFKRVLSKKNIIDKKIIIDTVLTKSEICSKDPYDKNIRKILNFGHTFAHILETLSDFKISHGLAVAFGIIVASHLSYKMRYLTYDDFNTIKNLFSEFDFSQILTFKDKLKNLSDELIINDKKNTGKLNLVLLSGLFKPFIYKTDNVKIVRDIILESLNLI